MITGQRVRLRAIEREDLPKFTSWLNDREVTEYLLWSHPLSQAEEEGWYNNMLGRPIAEHPKGIEVETPDGWILVGNTSFNEVDWQHRAAEVGIFIGDKRFWGKGYGTEALRLMLRYGFNDLNLHRIYLYVFAENQRGIHSYNKVGFITEGTLRDAVYKNGRYQDVLVMSVLQPEWRANE